MATVRREPQQQRSRDRVSKILAATAESIADSGVEDLTIAAVAKRADMPAATVYRYFADRDELASTYFATEMAKIDQAISEAFTGLEVVTVRTLIETAMYSHLRYHQANPVMAAAWYRSPRARVVDEHARRQDERIGRWIREAMVKTGFLTENLFPQAEVILVRLADRTFEWIFAEPRAAEAQEKAAELFIEMAVPYLEGFATPVAIRGISGDQFLKALGELPNRVVRS